MDIFEFMYDKYKIKGNKIIRLIETFGGVGSQAKALKNINANFEHYRLCEFDKNAVKSYNAIHKTNFIPSNIMDLKGGNLGIVETNKYEYIMTYSFPCTDLSHCGKMTGMSKGKGTRSGLLWEIERILNECENLPQILQMENVSEIHGKNNINDFNDWIAFLETKGYKNYYDDLISYNFDNPQTRKRTYMISVLGDYNYQFPKGLPTKKCIGDIIENNVNKEYYLTREDLKKIRGWNSQQKPLDRIRILDDYSPTIIARDCGIGKCESGSSVIIYDMVGLRVFTPLERVRLMGFDDDDYYKMKNAGVSDRQISKQMGNSIVVNVLMAIYKELF